MTRTALPFTLSALVAALLLATSSSAIGDFPCLGSADSQSCLKWSTDSMAQGAISANATCNPDPINPSVSYCGYAKAKCTVALDCDYGSCNNGTCAGYAGDACPNGNTDCQAFFFCGTDNTCGGIGAPCANGAANSPIPSPNQQCTSNVCNTTTKTCNAPLKAGFCAGTALCAASVNAVTPSGSRKKAKRFIINGDSSDALECPAGFTACAFGTGLSQGFECIDAENDLEQCGGCVSPDAAPGQAVGEDCTTIPGVEGVSCSSGACVIETCAPGFIVASNGASCIYDY
ncbi:hypothetical protein RQP46_007793 [Phenoliferia psychrophenolica]